MSLSVRPLSEPALTRIGRALATGPHAATWAAETRRLGLEDGGGAAYFGHPMALPVLQLPGWAAPDAPRERLRAAEEAALTGYLYARLQDDAVDLRHDAPAVCALASWLHQAHRAALAQAGGAPALARADAAWARFHAAMDDEASRHRTLDWDAAAFDRSLDRLRPLALPAAALCGGALPAEAARALEALVRAHQLHIDLCDLEDDAAQRRSSYVLVRAGGWEPADRARTLFRERVLDALLDEIHAALDEAARWAPLAPWVHDRRARVHATGARAWGAFLRVIVGGQAPG